MRYITLLTLFLTTAARAQTPPTGVETRSGDRSVIVHWEPVPGAIGYAVYRSTDGGAYEQVIPPARITSYVDFAVENGRTYRYRVSAYANNQEGSPSDQAAEARPRVLNDSEFLDLVARTAFDFFWYEANSANGLIKDRNTTTSAASIASVGFGLTAYGVAAERGWITRAQARQRTLNTLEFFWRAPQSTAPDATGYRGFFYHFLNMETGRRSGTSELSTIDTALLLAGVRYAGRFFTGSDPQEARIRALSDSLYDRVDWNWASPNPPLVALGWRPELASGSERNGFRICNGNFCDWRGYNEAMILYLLALGSRTHPIPASAWTTWDDTYRFGFHYGHTFVEFPPLFGHQYSHVWVDFRGMRDAVGRSNGGLDYFENSRRATLAQRSYAIENPGRFAGYDANGWGITASDYPGGYRARGAPPAQNDDGTLVPTGPGGSYPFAPTESLAALRAYYDRYRSTAYGSLWGPYGFKDAVNPTRAWVATDAIGIDQGPIVLMIENGRRDAVWRVSMRDSTLLNGLRRAGFDNVRPVNTATTPGAGRTLGLKLVPTLAFGLATVTVTLATPEPVRLVVYDVAGRAVQTAEPGTLSPGTHEVPLDLTGLAGGVYVVRVRAGREVATARLVVGR